MNEQQFRKWIIKRKVIDVLIRWAELALSVLISILIAVGITNWVGIHEDHSLALLVSLFVIFFTWLSWIGSNPLPGLEKPKTSPIDTEKADD